MFGQDESSSNIKFDPITGESINSDSTSIKFDPITGEAINYDSTNINYKHNQNLEFINKSYLKTLNTNYSIGIGYATNKFFNGIQYTYDLKLSDNISGFGSIGYPFIFSIGLNWQRNYNQNGLTRAIGGGIFNGKKSININTSYQWELKESSNFFSLGLGLISFTYDDCSVYNNPICGKTMIFPVPIISIDRRF